MILYGNYLCMDVRIEMVLYGFVWILVCSISRV